jgi:hypothetical protein
VTRVRLSILIAAACMLMPAAAAHAGTMTVSSEVFPGGAAAPDGIAGTVHVAPGSIVKLTAPQFLYVPGTTSTSPSVYAFVFWNADAVLRRKVTATFRAPATAFKASAWYLLTGGGSCPTCVPDVTTWAFNLTADKLLTQSPIASVKPTAAWTPGSTAVSTTDAAVVAAGRVRITAASKLALIPGAPIPSGPRASYYAFNSWFQFAGDGKIFGDVLSVPASGDSDAIAFYRLHIGFVVPLPCKTPPCPLPM